MSLLLSTLAAVVAALDRVGIPHMAVGSVASTYYGEPRTTQDVDIVIDPTAEQLQTFVDRFDRERYYVGDRLDADDLRTWAGELGIADSIERLREEIRHHDFRWALRAQPSFSMRSRNSVGV